MFDILSLIYEYAVKILNSPIFQSNLVNFLVMVFILYKLAAPFVKKMINQAAENTKNTVEESYLKKEEALKRFEEAKEKYENTPQDIDYIVRTANDTLNSLEKKYEEDTNKTKKDLFSNADKSIQSEKARIISEITSDTANKSLLNAKENIMNMLKEDENLHDRLIEQSIEELELSK